MYMFILYTHYIYNIYNIYVYIYWYYVYMLPVFRLQLEVLTLIVVGHTPRLCRPDLTKTNCPRIYRQGDICILSLKQPGLWVRFSQEQLSLVRVVVWFALTSSAWDQTLFWGSIFRMLVFRLSHPRIPVFLPPREASLPHSQRLCHVLSLLEGRTVAGAQCQNVNSVFVRSHFAAKEDISPMWSYKECCLGISDNLYTYFKI